MSNEELCIDVALDIMCSKGWIEDDEDPDEWVVDMLRRLYREGPELVRTPIVFRRRKPQLELGEGRFSVMWWNMHAARPAESLAYMWEYEMQLEWQRHQPAWECGYCETLVAADQDYWGSYGIRKIRFYELDDTGAFAGEVTCCPGCGRNLQRMIDREPQLVLFEWEQLE